MRNEDLVREFGRGAVSGKGSNLYIEEDKLVNYWTTIAYRLYSVPEILKDELKNLETPCYIMNKTKYSATTSKIQSYIRRNIDIAEEFDAKEFEEIVRYAETEKRVQDEVDRMAEEFDGF